VLFTLFAMPSPRLRHSTNAGDGSGWKLLLDDDAKNYPLPYSRK